MNNQVKDLYLLFMGLYSTDPDPTDENTANYSDTAVSDGGVDFPYVDTSHRNSLLELPAEQIRHAAGILHDLSFENQLPLVLRYVFGWSDQQIFKEVGIGHSAIRILNVNAFLIYCFHLDDQSLLSEESMKTITVSLVEENTVLSDDNKDRQTSPTNVHSTGEQTEADIYHKKDDELVDKKATDALAHNKQTDDTPNNIKPDALAHNGETLDEFMVRRTGLSLEDLQTKEPTRGAFQKTQKEGALFFAGQAPEELFLADKTAQTLPQTDDSFGTSSYINLGDQKSHGFGKDFFLAPPKNNRRVVKRRTLLLQGFGVLLFIGVGLGFAMSQDWWSSLGLGYQDVAAYDSSEEEQDRVSELQKIMDEIAAKEQEAQAEGIQEDSTESSRAQEESTQDKGADNERDGNAESSQEGSTGSTQVESPESSQETSADGIKEESPQNGQATNADSTQAESSENGQAESSQKQQGASEESTHVEAEKKAMSFTLRYKPHRFTEEGDPHFNNGVYVQFFLPPDHLGETYVIFVKRSPFDRFPTRDIQDLTLKIRKPSSSEDNPEYLTVPAQFYASPVENNLYFTFEEKFVRVSSRGLNEELIKIAEGIVFNE